METWNLSVKEWRNIISILERLKTPNGASFNKLKGFNKTRSYNNAILLSRNKISSNHRRIIPRKIRQIHNRCINKEDNDNITIKLPRTLCNLIRSNSIPR